LQGKEEIDSPLVYSFFGSMIKEKKITNTFGNAYFQQYENAPQDDGINQICDMDLHLSILVMEEYIESNIFQIFYESIPLENFSSDSHEGLLINSFSKRDMDVPLDFEDSRLQIDHPKLQECSEKEDDVLEPLAEGNILSNSEESFEEEEFVPYPVDVDTYVAEKVASSNAIFQENTFPDASEKLDENIVFFFI